MPEAIVAAPAAGAPPPAATGGAGGNPPPASAGAHLTSVPAGDWFGSFKNAELKSYVQERKFTDPEQLAERYQSLEKLRGVPEDRLLKLPEKMEGDEARAIWEKLGAPKDAKGYEIPRDEKSPDPKFADWAEGTFHKNNLTKAQALGVVQAYNERMQADISAQAEFRKNAMVQADEALKKVWGPEYETNINIAKQGVKILGLDAKTLDIMEAVQGRETLFKNLQKIGVQVGESTFVAGQGAANDAVTTPEQATSRIKELMQDRKFVKKINKGDADALKTWNDLNRAAAPGEKSIG